MTAKWILVIDDDRAIRQLWIEILSKEEYRLIGCHDGTEGVDLIRSLVPDLILLDLRMPRMGGLEFLEYLAGQGRFVRYVPIVLVSGYLGDVTRVPPEVNLVGALEKPVMPAVLSRAVRRALVPHRRSGAAGPGDAGRPCGVCAKPFDLLPSVPGPGGDPVHLPCWAVALATAEGSPAPGVPAVPPRDRSGEVAARLAEARRQAAPPRAKV